MVKRGHFLLIFALIMFIMLIYQLFIIYAQSSGVGIFINIIGQDTTPPQINITKLGPTSLRNITVNGTYSENNSMANITIELNNSYKVLASIDTSSKTWSAFINLTEGWNRFYVLAYDSVGNLANVTSSSQGASVLSDTTKPSINLSSLPNQSSVANNSLITFSISDLYLADAFYTINDGTTKSFNSMYELTVSASDWIEGVNYIIVNATDAVNNVERKNFTFIYSNRYAVVLNASINNAQADINNTNITINNLQSQTVLEALVSGFAAEISVAEYNKTLNALGVVENLSNAVSAIQTLLLEILDANSTSQDNSTKTATINAKLEEIKIIKNTTIASIDVNLFNPNLTVAVENTTKNNVTNQILATVAGLSASDEQSFRDASTALQKKTTVVNKVQTLAKTFLNGRVENITLFEKNISISQTQSGEFYVNEFIDKNITGNNDLNANSDITNMVPQAMTVVVADPIVKWSFSDASQAVVSFSIDKSVPSEKITESKTIVTTTPTASSSTSSTTATGGGGAGGGAGGGGARGAPPATAVVTDFSTDKTAIKVILKQGQTKTETLRIKNIGTTIFDVKANLKELGKFVVSPVAEVTSTLNPSEENTIELVFRALENEKPDIYPGRITLKSPSIEKEIATIVEVDSAEPLFDVDVEVLADSKKVFAGEEILLEVNLFNVRGFGRVDVNVEYFIKDLKGDIIATEHETLAIETQAKFTRSLLVPSDLTPGTYVAFAKVIYGESVGTSSDLFEVKAKSIRLYPIQIKDYRVILLIGAVILVMGSIIFSVHRLGYFKKKIPQVKGGEIKQLKEEEKAQKLKKELEALESAHKSGLISEESYQRDKKRIEDKLKSSK